ncbi:Aste57867_1371 [Aphanomyces stellatus]|uniref:Aste57867_1371 protein n=1 Tax=Aphanomyces stellatus TaxID=120398 RepID=A0A485K551_9STRA|nr:hypothetical protein As57867_001370 [Aphanomyces stellatus]VFT78589.1 Aste57867_1371 [Aphanomyces stellatus]
MAISEHDLLKVNETLRKLCSQLVILESEFVAVDTLAKKFDALKQIVLATNDEVSSLTELVHDICERLSAVTENTHSKAAATGTAPPITTTLLNPMKRAKTTVKLSTSSNPTKRTIADSTPHTSRRYRTKRPASSATPRATTNVVTRHAPPSQRDPTPPCPQPPRALASVSHSVYRCQLGLELGAPASYLHNEPCGLFPRGVETTVKYSNQSEYDFKSILYRMDSAKASTKGTSQSTIEERIHRFGLLTEIKGCKMHDLANFPAIVHRNGRLGSSATGCSNNHIPLYPRGGFRRAELFLAFELRARGIRKHLALGTVAKITSSTDVNIQHKSGRNEDILWVTWHTLSTTVPDTKRLLGVYTAHDNLRNIAEAISHDCRSRGIDPPTWIPRDFS